MTWLFGALLFCGGILSRPEVPPPVYDCPRIAREITLDGRLSDPLWKTAPVVRLVYADSGGAADRLTEVRLLYSATTLYIGFLCEDDFVWGMNAEPDSDIYREECKAGCLNATSGRAGARICSREARSATAPSRP